MSKFLKNGMQCLYLDQFAVSNICEPPIDSEWTDISTLIREGIHRERLLCPSSFENIIETLAKDEKRSRVQDRELDRISRGWHFRSEPEISANYLICKVRDIKLTQKHFMQNQERQHLDEPAFSKRLGDITQQFREMAKDAAAPANAIRTLTQGGVRGSKSMRDSLVAIIKDDYKGHLIERMQLLAIKGSYRPRLITLAGHIIPFWADTLCSILTNKYELTKQEAKKAEEILQIEGIESIPSLSIRASLEAILAHKGALETSNDHIDILRISGALHVADMMIVDGPKAHDIRELELNQKFQTVVYSGRKSDLGKLKESLSALVNG